MGIGKFKRAAYILLYRGFVQPAQDANKVNMIVTKLIQGENPWIFFV